MVHIVDFFKNKFAREKYEKELNAVKTQRNPNELARIALNSDFSNVRMEAVNRISDEYVLANIAQKDSNSNVRKAAVCKITDEYVLEGIVRNDSNRSVRNLAQNRLEELGHG